MSRTVELNQLGATLRHDKAQQERAMRVASYVAALRGEAIVVAATPSDRGLARQGWRTVQTADGAELRNDVPYIGILEKGSRPHRPPIMPILRWVVRQWGVDLAGGKRSFKDLREVPWQTWSVARAIQEKIATEGTEPHFMVQDNLPTLRRYLREEVEARLSSSGGGEVPF